MVRAYAIALLFSTRIAPFVGAVMPRLAPWVWQRDALSGELDCHRYRNGGNGDRRRPGRDRGAARHRHDSRDGFRQLVSREHSHRDRCYPDHRTVHYGLRDDQGAGCPGNGVAQLASLESRVQPHFLFNTLNSIAALIHEDPKGAERMTGQLASLMRSSLDQQATPLVALDDELQTVRDYLAIEQVRFGERLRYRIDVDEPARRARIPRLSIQTLVEKQREIRGLPPSRQGASITITATASTSRPPAPTSFRISVEDDGPGFDPAVVTGGHGLALLKDRTALAVQSVGERHNQQLSRPHGRHLDGPRNARPPGMIRSFILDDERLAVQRLERLLRDTGRVQVVGTSTDSQDALETLRPAATGRAVPATFRCRG